MGRPPIPMRRVLKLAVPVAELWPLIANTDRFNRALGLPKMEVVGREGFDRLVRTRLFGLRLSWRERPFDWVQHRFFRSVREFDSGPIERFEGGMTIAPADGGCEVVIESVFTPRNLIGELLVRHATGKRAIEDAETMVRRFESSLRGGPAPFPMDRAASPYDGAALLERADKLHASPVDKKIAQDLVHFLMRGYDDELTRMRPFELADAWKADRLETLKVFLHSVKAGLLDMSWEVICPTCTAPTEKPSRLSELRSKAHCDSCKIEYGVNFDESVELRFSISAAIRKIESHTYCVGSPARTPFARAQLLLKPGERREELVELPAESFILRDMAGKRSVSLRPSEDGPTEFSLELGALSGELRFKPGPVRLKLAAGPAEALARLESESWAERGAKASLVTTIQEFRDLFSSEVLAPGVEIAVRTISVLFSDLKDSTALYERIGDATAYSIVRDHFDYLFAIIARRRGAVVKTIGDAVMAVFSNPGDAMAAALEMQESITALDLKLKPRTPVIIKLGLHEGPAIAINAGGTIDYFGTTINVAARVQNESKGSDIVITAPIGAHAGARGLIEKRAPAAEEFTIKLKGLSNEFKLWRLKPTKKDAAQL